ncbi:unnamed protein product [Leptosia nina]|uniref:Nucleoside phosphorylase domain-containing protein n=1 Tax=Leptosia nina TaxID=320188 RepID=A0AAV1JGJ6_9NEOP
MIAVCRDQTSYYNISVGKEQITMACSCDYILPTKKGWDLHYDNCRLNWNKDKPFPKNDDGTIRLPNEHLNKLDCDILYHLGFVTGKDDLEAMFGDVKFVCMGGTKYRMKAVAAYMSELLKVPCDLKNLVKDAHRYVMYKVGPVLCVNHGIGIPSLSVVLEEVLKLLSYAKAKDPVFFRLGTSGGMGIPAGSVVISSWGMSGTLEKTYDLPILGKMQKFPSIFDKRLNQELYSISINEDFNTCVAGTVAANDFYRGEGRTDGAFCDYTEADKFEFLQKLVSLGVRNLEMEATAFASYTREAGVRAADLCVTFLDRLLGDQVTPDQGTLSKWQQRPAQIVGKYIAQYYGLGTHLLREKRIQNLAGCIFDSPAPMKTCPIKNIHLSQVKRSEALSGRLSKSASELSCSAPVQASPPRARSAHHHTPLSVVHRTHHFFSNLKNRWHRSKSRERCPAGTILSVAPGADSSGTEYDHSSDHTPANSPLHRKRKGQLKEQVDIVKLFPSI